MKLERYENMSDSVDAELLNQDEYTFFVLKKILKGDCSTIITDHHRLIICYSCSPFPVWIWIPDDAEEEEMDRVWNIIKKEFPLDKGFRFNVKYFLSEYLIKRAAQENLKLEIKVNLFAYNCPEIIPPAKTPEGTFGIAVREDFEDVYSFVKKFHKEIGGGKESDERYQFETEALIQSQRLYLWKNKSGENTAMCTYNIDGDKCSIAHVFTKETERRCGYGQNLVYEVTKLIKEKGKMPTLYTDADYAASNACYEKIGYRLKGKLCTIGKA